MSNSAGGSRKAEDAYPKSAPGPCSKFSVQFRVVLLALSLCVYYFWVLLGSLWCVSVFDTWSLSLDFIILFSGRILIPCS